MVGLGGQEVGDCTTAVVKEDAQEVTEKVVMTTFGLKRNKPARHAKLFVSLYLYKLICSD